MTVLSSVNALKRYALWASGGILVALSVVARAEELSAVQLLESMGQSMQERSYTGTFVYLHDGRMEAMKVARRQSEKGNDEKLLSLNGEPREVIRRDNVVTQVLPGSGLVMVDHSRVRSQLPMSVPMELKGVDRYYHVRKSGVDRIAGRPCLVVTLQPKDAYRYGRRFWIDEQSHLLVKVDLLDAQGRAIEQLMYTELRVEEDLPESLFEGDFDSSALKRHEIMPPTGDLYDEHHWMVGELPSGFSLTTHERRVRDEGALEHMVYSDGLATLSVFVEPVGEGEPEPLAGHSNIGAINAYGRVIGDHKVVVVGEVPLVTVKQVNRNVERRLQ